jgi:epoxyqueuosine reductase
MTDWAKLASAIKAWGAELGFQKVAISDTDLSSAEPGLSAWLAAGCHGEMDYMARHGAKRTRPADLHPGTLRVISARMNYWPGDPARAGEDGRAVLADPARAYVSRYALGRDYHKVMRARLQQLAERVAEAAGPHGHRVFTDSAPVMEVELAQKSGLGWRGKHTLLLSREAGSYFFLGEIYTSLPLPVDAPVEAHCGTCTQCIDACPTGAITGPYRVDARRCISYLTIELKGAIPEDLRPLIGNRVYGCDDCQLTCPWNSFAERTAEPDFGVRNGLDAVTLTELFGWSEAEFRERLAGSAIFRIGHERWLRNIAVAIGNAAEVMENAKGDAGDNEVAADMVRALEARLDHPSALVREHVQWALAQHARKRRAEELKGTEN